MSKNTALTSQSSCHSNRYKIDLIGDTFDLSKLPTGFDIKNARNWKNATVDDNILTVSDPTESVTYTYDLGNSQTTTFRLFWDSCTITEAMIASIEDQEYTNTDIEPEITITCGSYTLISGTDDTVSYENNKNVGTATATVTGKGDFYKGRVSVTFKIVKASQSAPSGITNTAETIDGKADGKITGVTSAMEYRKDGTTDYTAIAGTEITGLADGKYYVRYKADANHNASADTEVMVAAGRKLTVTVPNTQVGYTLTVNKTELVWNDSVTLTFELKEGYSTLDTFAVQVDGTSVTLDANGQFTLSPASGTQTVVATDKAGNVSAEMIVTVNDRHATDTSATCMKKAECKHCGVEYGEVDNSNHDLENIKGSAATVTETGNTEYWHCKDCGNNFSDKDGKNAIELKDTVIGKLPPEIIDGKGQSLTEGEKKELTFRSNAAYSDFIRVEVDGETVDEKNDTVKKGSTIVTLKADYVATLSVGEHTLGIVSQSGTATTTFTVNAKAVDTDSPETGDNSHMALWFALLFVSGGALVGTAAYGKKRKYSAK